jgi:hypothetical protein
MDKQEAGGTSKEVSTTPVTPKGTGNNGGQNDRHKEQQPDIVLVLEADNGVVDEVGDVSDTGLAAGLENHPANVRPEQTVVSSIGIEISVGVTMVSTVSSRPPLDRTLDGTSSGKGEDVLEGDRSVVGTMCPQTMVACSDTQTGHKVPKDGKDGSLELEGDGHKAVDSDEGCEGEGEGADPVDVLERITPGNWRKRLRVLERVLDIVVGDV